MFISAGISVNATKVRISRSKGQGHTLVSSFPGTETRRVWLKRLHKLTEDHDVEKSASKVRCSRVKLMITLDPLYGP